MARRDESRAESIERLRKAAIRDIKAGLKKRNISIPEIEGAAEDDVALRDLQEWQAIAKAFEDSASESSAQEGNRGYSMGADFSSSALSDQATSADTMDSGTPKSKSKGL